MQLKGNIVGVSVLKLYSFGRAAANLQKGQKELEVIPIEQLSHLDGEVTDNITTLTSKGSDKDDNQYQVQVEAGNSVKAKWLSRNPNRPYPGLIRRGDELLLWRVGDTDQYYWEETGASGNKRRLDVYVLAISNTKNEEADALTPQNSYFLEINTVDKIIALVTNKSDGEPYAYNLQLNTKDGALIFTDDVQNSFQLDSKEQLLEFLNGAGSFIRVDKEEVGFFANQKIYGKTRQFMVECEDFDVKATNTVKISGTTLAQLTSSTALELTAPTVGLNGNITGSGYGGGSGTMNIQLQTTFNNGVTVDGELINNGTNVGSTHSHLEQGDGKDVGPPH